MSPFSTGSESPSWAGIKPHGATGTPSVPSRKQPAISHPSGDRPPPAGIEGAGSLPASAPPESRDHSSPSVRKGKNCGVPPGFLLEALPGSFLPRILSRNSGKNGLFFFVRHQSGVGPLRFFSRTSISEALIFCFSLPIDFHKTSRFEQRVSRPWAMERLAAGTGWEEKKSATIFLLSLPPPPRMLHGSKSLFLICTRISSIWSMTITRSRSGIDPTMSDALPSICSRQFS